MTSVRQHVYPVQTPESDALDVAPRGEAAALEILPSVNSDPDAIAETPGATSEVEFLEPRLILPRIRVDVFASSDDLLATVERVAGDRRAVRSAFAINPGGFAEAVDRYREHPPADLLVIEDTGSADQLEWRVEALAEFCPPSTRLVVIGERNDIVLYRRLIKMGVSDYLVHPVKPLVLLDSIASIFVENESAKDIGLVIAFLGARGGVGSSTVAQNAAAIIGRKFDATTLLIDADPGFGTAALQFDIASTKGLSDALKERDDLHPELLEKLIHWRDKRFGILTAPERPDQMVASHPGAMLHLVDQARRLAKYVVLDLPHGWAPWTAEVLSAADRVVVVATPDLPSLRNARTLLGLISDMRPNDEPAHVVLNRMPVRAKPSVSADDFTRTLNQKIGSVLPWDDAAAAAEMAGRVLAEDAPASQTVAGIEVLVARIVGEEPRAQHAKSSTPLFRRLFAKRRK